MSTPNHRHHQLLSLLLREWEDTQAPIGPAKYLQVQELLRQTPTDQPLEQWRGRLAPLFCRNPQEQEQFYATFERCVQALNAIDSVEALPLPPPGPIEPDPKVEQAKKRWQASLYLLLAVGVGLMILLWFLRKEEEEVTAVDPIQPARIERFSLAPGEDLSRNLRPSDDTSTLRSATPREWQGTPLGGLYRVDSTGLATYIANRDAKVGAVDTALILYDLSTGRDSVYWLADIIGPQKSVEVDTGLIAELPLPYPNNAAEFASLAIDEKAQARYEWYRRWQWPLKAALWLLLGALAWATVRWDQYRRAKVVAELQRPERAPYIWSPETGLKAEDFLRADAAPLLTRLRGRSPDERERLDLCATLFASIRAGGRIQLRYRRSTLPPDYLLLIDRHAGQDHRARLFEALYQVFLQAEAPVSRYFYDGDPRTCFNELYPEGVALNELLQRHAGAQLLLLGEGQALLSNLSGRLAPWTNLLEAWPRRALLLTRPMQSWGRREKELQKLLPLLPASPAGLSAAIDLFNAPEPAAVLPDLLRNVPDALQQPISFEHELIKDLQRQFSPELLDWIAACALWPALHWDLTLYLGKVLSDRNEGENGPKGNGETASVLSFAGIRELTRLPWFVEGRIPDSVRLTLVRYLQERGLEQALRQALATLLQQAPAPPADSVAYEDYRLNLIVNELFMRPDAQRKRELEREFAQYLAAGKQPDFVALQVLNRPQTALDVLVGDRLKKYAFKGGLPGLGWQLWTKLLSIWLVCGLGIAFIQPFRSPCAGEKVEYQQQTYCLKDSRDRLLYLEQLAADAIDAREYPRVDSLVQAADALKRLDSAFYLNTATHYYNAGAAYFNCGKQNNCIGLSADSARQVACTHFTRGAALAQSRLGQPGLEYYLAQQRACTPQAGDEPVQAPVDTNFVIQGTVLDALSQSPIAGAQVRLNGQRARSDRNGQYQFRVRASSLGTRLELQATATDYEPLRLNIPPQTQLPPLRLSPSNTKLEREAWAKATAANTPEAYTIYLEAFPNGPNAAEANKRITAAASAKEQAAWTEAQRLNTLVGYQNFLRQYPGGAFSSEAQNRIVELQDDADWASAQATNTPAACAQYLQKYPNGRHAAAARQCANPAPPPVEVPRPAMVRVPGGSFEMGDVFDDTERNSSEKPVHTVRLDAFEIGRYEVTFAEYDLFCEATKRENKPSDESWGRGSRPVIYVSWEDAIAYCNWLSEQHGYQPVYSIKRDGSPVPDWNANGYRLPTEAEWEYAARAGGKKVRFGNGKDIADPKEINFYALEDAKQNYSIVGEYRAKTLPVGSLNSPNALGLHDMSGNVLEWCWDWYAKYSGKPESNPRGPNTGVGRVLRGGSWGLNPVRARVARRSGNTPDGRSDGLGFRLARRQ